MINYLNQLRVKTKLIILTGILMSGLVFYGLTSFLVLQKIKILGPYYNKIIQGKDLIADILPPPAYIIESYLLAFQEAINTDTNVVNELISRTRELEDDFEIRYEYWKRMLPEGHLKEIFTINAYRAGKKFFDIWKDQFVQAIKEGNRDVAFELLKGPLQEAYNQHRKYIDEIVTITTLQNKETEAEAKEIDSFSNWLTVILWTAIVLIGALLAYLINRSINEKLQDVMEGLNAISHEIEARMDAQSQAVAQQSTSVHETTSAMDELNTSFQHTEMLTQDSTERAKKALTVSEDGNTLLKQMLDSLFSHRDKMTTIVEQIKLLSEISIQIHQIASVASNLTNQTNILALNAAVQAANVKQHSSGFSVIASEIRKLADEIKRFLSQIDILAENIHHAIDSTVSSVEEGNQTLQDNIKLAQTSAKAFDSIIAISTNSFEGTQQVCLNVKQQGNAVHQVLEAMEVINESSQQTLKDLAQVRIELSKLNSLATQLEAVI